MSHTVQHTWWAATTIFVQWTGEYLANKTQYICLIPVQHMQCTATTIFVQRTGDYCGPQDLSNICGAQLPPYLFSGLVSIWPTRLSIYVSYPSNICSAQLPPYLFRGLVIIVDHRTCPIYAVHSYHHICSVDW